jgi:hypothetical protein
MSKELMLTHAGRTQTLHEWADETGFTYACLQSRLRYVSISEALTRPLSNKGRPRKDEDRELVKVIIKSFRQYLHERLPKTKRRWIMRSR